MDLRKLLMLLLALILAGTNPAGTPAQEISEDGIDYLESEPGSQLDAYLGTWEDSREVEGGYLLELYRDESGVYHMDASFFRMCAIETVFTGEDGESGSLRFETEDGEFLCDLYLEGDALRLNVESLSFYPEYFAGVDYIYHRTDEN